MKFSEKRKVLNEKLKELCKLPDYEKDFLLGINALLKNEEDVNIMLNFLKNNDNIPEDEISLKALELYHKKDLRGPEW